MTTRMGWGLSLVLAAATGCSEACPSDASFLEALAGLGEGGTLVVPAACTLTTGFVVEAGRHVEGGRVILEAGERIELVPSSGTATELGHMAIESRAGDVSLLIDGAGESSVHDVTLDLQAGIGIAVRSGNARLSGIDVVGNLDPARVATLPLEVDPSMFATYGLVVLDGATVTLDDARLSATANGGVLCEDATVTASRTTLDAHRTNGAAFYGCTVSLASTAVTGTLATLSLPMGVIVSDGTFEASDLSLGSAPGFGVFVDHARAIFDAPSVVGLGRAGIFGSVDAEVTIRDGVFTDNRGAAIASIGGRSLTVSGTAITGTMGAPILTPSGGSAEIMADGIHVAQRDSALEGLTVTDTTLSDNARVGMVIDGGGLALSPTLTAVDASGSGAALGVVAQNTSGLPATWDGGVMRSGSPATLDMTAPVLPVSTGISLAGILMPPVIMF